MALGYGDDAKGGRFAPVSIFTLPNLQERTRSGARAGFMPRDRLPWLRRAG
jgi:hypothetical protein